MKKWRVRAIVVSMLAAAGLVAGTMTANATIYWYSQTLQNSSTGYCATVALDTDYANMQPCSPDLHDKQNWNLVSSAPDAGGHAYVEIQNAYNPDICLYAKAWGSGPSQIAHSSDVEGESCSAGDPSEIWAMSTQSPPSGSTHHIQFFTFGEGDCLDGGIGLYGFPESGCNTGNPWQTWNVFNSDPSF